MSWRPLSERIGELPLVLAGPILRKTTKNSVSVWIAFRKPCSDIKLNIYESIGAEPIESRTFGTFQFGKNLHIVLLTSDNLSLVSDHIYFYNISFTVGGENLDLTKGGVLNESGNTVGDIDKISYSSYTLPSFLLPASLIYDLRIMHGSCRKIHGAQMVNAGPQSPEYFVRLETSDIDALSILDKIISDYYNNPKLRPQQLFLTGDQIYGDDVADLLLYMIFDAGSALIDINENLPRIDLTIGPDPLTRYESINTIAEMSSGEYAKCHLMRLSEFYCMYLFAWSDTLWADLPEIDHFKSYITLSYDKEHFEISEEDYQIYFDNEIKVLKDFMSNLPRIRKSLANIATYMMFDDHEITDDWFIDQEWSEKVLKNELGTRVIQNGLSAFAIFQAWGNTPEKFSDTLSLEYQIRENLEKLSKQGGDTEDQSSIYWGTISDFILPKIVDSSANGEDKKLIEGPDWYYYICFDYYQVIVLNTRTQRGYNSNGLSRLLSSDALYKQLKKASVDNSKYEFTIIVAPGPVIGHTNLEYIQEKLASLKDKYRREYDYESWGCDPSTLSKFLSVITRYGKVIILSGDVHYAFSAKVDYNNKTTLDTAKIAQLTSSGLKNSEKKTTRYAFRHSPVLGLPALSGGKIIDWPVDLDPFTQIGWDTDTEYIVSFIEDTRQPNERGEFIFSPAAYNSKTRLAFSYKSILPFNTRLAVGYCNIGEIYFTKRHDSIILNHKLWYKPEDTLIPDVDNKTFTKIEYEIGPWTLHEIDFS